MPGVRSIYHQVVEASNDEELRNHVAEVFEHLGDVQYVFQGEEYPVPVEA